MNAPVRPISVSSGDLVRQFGRWQDHVSSQPVLVTHHGRERAVLLSAALYHELIAAPATRDGIESSDAALFEQAMEQVAEGFILFDQEMIVRAINHAACCFLKTVREAMVGARLDEKLPGIRETIGYAGLGRAARSGSMLTFEMPSFAYDGRWLLVRTFPFGGRVACLFRDITDEVEARHRFDAHKAADAAVAAHGGIGRASLAPHGTFAAVDAALERITGFTAAELAPVRMVDLLCGPGRAAAAAAVQAALDGGAPCAAAARLLDRSGAVRDVRIGLAPLRIQGRAEGASLAMTMA